MVVFKRPKRPHTVYEVMFVEQDYAKVQWSAGGLTPNYILVRAVDGKNKGEEQWTCENKLRLWNPPKKG